MFLLSERPPSAPNNLEVLLDNKIINLHWKSSSKLSTLYPTTYIIEVSTDSGLSWIAHTEGIKGLYYIVDKLHSRILYQFRVKAHNVCGFSEATNTVNVIIGNKHNFIMLMMKAAIHV